MGDHRAVTVDAVLQQGCGLIACRVCGPLGVAQDRRATQLAVFAHLAWHGCDMTQINVKEQE